MGVAHYLEALEWQKEIVKIHTIFGGKNPHPNYLVGRRAVLAQHRRGQRDQHRAPARSSALLDQDASEFVEQVYIPDLMAIARFYKDWGGIGGGLKQLPGVRRPADERLRRHGQSFKFPRGVILDRNLTKVLPVDGKDPMQVQEYVTHSWYEYAAGNDKADCTRGTARPPCSYTGPQPPYEHLEVESRSTPG